ncbi:hypothetical protein GIB67_026321 [Kingdonia uniflora]|uniref:Transmembrane protein n=1 Tax=Kingdonia uniflora TaxID=39325 RepID=A0A7J7N5V9_9MAGN|nr:hypothetical protein GIB67_026321 [Kingdonia uniflora]
MKPEDTKASGVDPSKRTSPGEVLHQRRKLPYSPITMAITGLAITGTIAYFTLYAKKKPEASAMDVAKVTTGVADPRDTHPQK